MTPFPLPAGHRFGRNPFALSVHTGSDPVEAHFLRLWQQRFARMFDRSMAASGRYDGPTQRAAFAIQRWLGLPVTGDLDLATWEGLWATETVQKAEPVGSATPGPSDVSTDVSAASTSPVVVGKDLRRTLRNQEAQRVRTEIIVEHSVRDHPWWTVAVSPGDVGPDVVKIRSAIGDSTQNDTYTAGMAQKIKGLQRLAGLTPDGVVDLATAWLLEDRAAKPVE